MTVSAELTFSVKCYIFKVIYSWILLFFANEELNCSWTARGLR